MVFALGEVEALVAAFTRLLLFVLFPGTLLENIKKTQESCVKVFSLFSFSTTEGMSDGSSCFILCLAVRLPFLLSINKDTDRLSLLLKTTNMEVKWRRPQQHRLSDFHTDNMNVCKHNLQELALLMG